MLTPMTKDADLSNYLLSFRFHNPVGDGADGVVEVGADLDYLATVGTRRQQIVTVAKLCTPMG